MKNTKITYLLILSVLIIWGIIGYRFFTSLSDEKKFSKIDQTNTYTIKNDNIKNYTLKLNYRDPFLGKIFHQTTTKKVVVRKTSKVENKINLDGMVFNGLITNGKNKIAIINFHGQEYLIKEGETFNQMTFLKHYKDSTLIRVSGQNIILKR